MFLRQPTGGRYGHRSIVASRCYITDTAISDIYRRQLDRSQQGLDELQCSCELVEATQEVPAPGIQARASRLRWYMTPASLLRR